MGDVVIGIVDQGKEEKLRLYADAVAAAGARFEVLPWTGDADRDAARFDGLVLCGGDDVDAARWGEANHPTVETVPPIRDEYEIRFVRRAIELGVPLLGVCRGSQVMNVALGGTLIQHVPEVPGAGVHGGGARHDVDFVPGSRLAGIAGRPRASVNTWHHQAVGRLASRLSIAARSGDGIVEAVEAGGAPFAIGVQWHPEREGNDEPLGRGLFVRLVEAARERHRRNPGTGAPARASQSA